MRPAILLVLLVNAIVNLRTASGAEPVMDQAPAQDDSARAMFTFTQGADPQLWFLIEARKTEDGHQWQYAFARFDAKVEFQVCHHQS